MPLDRDRVVSAALDLLDEQGLDALTLRALATRLGVRAPTLYWHVKDKAHLLDLVADRMGADLAGRESPDPLEGEDVVAWLARMARGQRRALVAHRDGARVVAGYRPTLRSLTRIERSLEVLVAAGLEPADALRTLAALGSFVLGDALETQLARTPGPGTADALRTAGYPLLGCAGAALGTDEDRFEHGLALLLAGLRGRLASGGRRSRHLDSAGDDEPA